MHRIASAAAVASIVLLAACSRGYEAESEPAPAASSAALDPVGVYDFSASMGGMTRTGTLTVTRTDTGYGGEATVEGESQPATITGARVEGNVITVEVLPPNGGGMIDFVMTMSGSTFTGNVVVEGQTLPITGTKH